MPLMHFAREIEGVYCGEGRLSCFLVFGLLLLQDLLTYRDYLLRQDTRYAKRYTPFLAFGPFCQRRRSNLF